MPSEPTYFPKHSVLGTGRGYIRVGCVHSIVSKKIACGMWALKL